QDEKSQHKNKAAAMAVLKARLFQKMRSERDAEQAAQRKAQVGTGERSERIRTYNFPQGRVTDHRVGVTLHRLEAIMEGGLDELLDAVGSHFQAEALRQSGAAVAV
ncbi:MAG: peptide chain release factor 1, partial [Myxococcales bacterium]|nr:peptide chain release factor 1 [Myxococcales bacterium]